MPDNPYCNCSLTVINGFVTSVGGGSSNTLLSLTGEGERKQWSEIFPAMSVPVTCHYKCTDDCLMLCCTVRIPFHIIALGVKSCVEKNDTQQLVFNWSGILAWQRG